MAIRLLITLVMISTIGCGSSASPDIQSTTETTVTASAPPPVKTKNAEIMARIIVFDAAIEFKPMHPKAELWMKGVGSVWLKRDKGRNLKRVPAGTPQHFFLYPEGRGGPEYKVEFTMQPGWNPNGDAEHSIIIDFEDNAVNVIGHAIEGRSKKFAR